MSEIFIKDYIEKIVFLEKKIGMKPTYPILEPFSFDSKDVIAIQKAA